LVVAAFGAGLNATTSTSRLRSRSVGQRWWRWRQRDEVDVAPRSFASLAQDYPATSIILVDDNSQTARRRLAAGLSSRRPRRPAG
jgi:hypothetical protein